MPMTLSRRLSVFVFPLLIVLFLITLTFTSFFKQTPTVLSQAIILDLIITLPLVYLISIWKTSIPRYTVLSCVVIGMVIASVIIPQEHQGFFLPLKGILIPLIEFSIIGMIAYKCIQIKKKMGADELSALDFYDKIMLATQDLFPSTISRVLSSEIAVPYYIFKKRPTGSLRENEFSYYKKSGITIVIYTMMLLAIAELSVVHILLEKFNTTIAWIASGLTFYSMLQILALVRSLPHRNHVLDSEKNILRLKYGFSSYGILPITNIKSILLSSRQMAEDPMNKTFSPLGFLDTHNVIVELKNPWTYYGFYGRETTCKKLALYIDDKQEFYDKISRLITE